MTDHQQHSDTVTEQLGRDEWVSEHDRRVRQDRAAAIGQAIDRIPFVWQLVAIAAIGLAFPLFTDDSYVLRIVATVALFASVAMGLNLVAGFAGLLDLGYVAFYGIGAYVYAYFSSDFTGIHLPTWLTLLVVVCLGALFGWLLGLPSMRLTGDYLAIATLGFLLVFIQLSTSLTRVSLPWSDEPVDLTGGPNGIVNLDDFSIFGFSASSVTDYLFILFGLLILVMTVIRNLDRSRIGRGWRALRENELAADVMGMPTKRLKLLAFVFGSSIAGLSGAAFAAWQGAVFPNNFAVPALIMAYSIIVLGGLGSLHGVLIGAFVLVVVPELLRDVGLASTLFYGAVLLTLFVAIRPRWQAGLVVAATALLGVVVRIAVPGAETPGGEALGALVAQILVVPGADPELAGNIAFALVLGLLFISAYLPTRRARLISLVPMLWLLALAWNTRLAQSPSITRLLLIGLTLVALMNFRPAGLFGRTRVEVM